MSEAPFVNFYTSDFLAGTGGMTAATKGVYITLLCLMYEAERPLSQSIDALARRCGCTVPALIKALDALEEDGKITRGSDGIWSKTCDKHIASRRERRNSAKAAAEKRWQKSEEKQVKSHAGASNPQCKPDPEPEISPNGDIDISPVDQVADAFNAYNAAAERNGWAVAQKVTPARRSSLKARLSDCGGPEGWRIALEKAEASDFVNGRTEHAFRCDLDFLLQQKSFTRLMEGKYDNRNPGASGTGTPRRAGAGTVDAFAAVAHRLAARSGGH